jgi:DNA-binding IclR family transcriptional regulator
MLHQNNCTVVHMRAGARPFGISSDVGTQVPLPWTASGRLLLSHLAAPEIRAMVSPEDLISPGGRAIDLEEFVTAVEAARRDGYCIISGLVDAYTHCIAAPVLDQKGMPRPLSASWFRSIRLRIGELRDILVESGRSLSLLRDRASDQDQASRGTA